MIGIPALPTAAPVQSHPGYRRRREGQQWRGFCGLVTRKLKWVSTEVSLNTATSRRQLCADPSAHTVTTVQPHPSIGIFVQRDLVFLACESDCGGENRSQIISAVDFTRGTRSCGKYTAHSLLHVHIPLNALYHELPCSLAYRLFDWCALPRPPHERRARLLA